MLTRLMTAVSASALSVWRARTIKLCRILAAENEGRDDDFGVQQPFGAKSDAISFKFRNQASL
jgi:hypothetical protein